MKRPLISLTMLAGLAMAACSAEPQADAVSQSTDDASSTPTEDSAREALQTYFDAHLQCTPFFDLPAEVREEPGSYRIKQLEAFVAAGLLQRTGNTTKLHEVTGAPERYARYVASTTGSKWLKPGKDTVFGSQTIICYGKRKIGKVEVGTPDAISPDRLGVKYEYTLVDIPSWTHAPSITAMYPGLATRVTGAVESDSEDLVHRSGKWTLAQQTAFNAFDFRQQSH